MNRLRWIFGIPLSFAIGFGVIILFVYYDKLNDYADHHLTFYWFYHLLTVATSFFLIVFLSCFFVPSNRKYALLITASTIFILAALGLFYKFKENNSFRDVSGKLTINFAGIFIGLLLGIYVSHQIFKNRNWSLPKIIEEDKEVY